MSNEKWKKAIKKIASSREEYHLERKGSVLSNYSMGSIQEEETNQDEVDTYVSRLKSKTGLRGLWSGNKFEKVVDDDKTPDISLDSSDEDDINTMNFNRIKLDSDEDEMRIDYMRESSIDVNNNYLDDGDSDDDSDGGNLMNNIHFAELKVADFELNDSEDGDVADDDDFLPNVHTINFSDDGNEEDGSDKRDYSSDFDPHHNVKFMSSIESEVSVTKDHWKGPSPKLGNKEKQYSSFGEGVDDEIKTESELSSGVRISRNERRDSDSNSRRYESDFSSESSGRTQTRSRKKSANTETQMSSRRSPRRMTSRSDRRNDRNKNRKIKSARSVMSLLSDSSTNTDTTGTLSSTSSLATDPSSPCRKHSRSLSRKTSKSSVLTNKKKRLKQVSTETQTMHVPSTADILNFNYPWQQDKPHNIASHVVDGDTMHVLTSYEPAVLAAHDMMKYHFKLLQQHIDNSRRLYQSYTSDTVNSNYKYTTVEDTMKYIKKNRPKTLSYEEALKKVKAEEAER